MNSWPGLRGFERPGILELWKFVFLCPFCGRKLKAEEGAAGRAVDCPDCQGEFLVPEMIPETEPQEVPPPPEFPCGPSPSVPAPNIEGEHNYPICWLRFDRGDS